MREADKRDPAGVKDLLLQVVRPSDGMSLLQVNIARHFVRAYWDALSAYVPTGARTRLTSFLDRIEQRMASVAAELKKPVEDVMLPADDPLIQGFRDEVQRLDGDLSGAQGREPMANGCTAINAVSASTPVRTLDYQIGEYFPVETLGDLAAEFRRTGRVSYADKVLDTGALDALYAALVQLTGRKVRNG